DDGWLYKHSGSADDGYKTNEALPNPYEEALCFLSNNPCPTPPADELLTYLPEHLDIPQLLRMGAVNGIIANTDAPLGKDNNYYFYDWAGGGRLYIPWDLDTVMKDNSSLFSGSGTTLYTGVLFTHWEDDYDAILTELLEGPLDAGWIDEELALASSVAKPALDADPFVTGSTFDEAAANLQSWWSARHPVIHEEVLAH
ncbi:MAG: CotH kinase family protein, partial [Polyangiaceae bacterium]|nr:CotH kinase family protein [Polyangiaceae bacterium]